MLQAQVQAGMLHGGRHEGMDMHGDNGMQEMEAGRRGYARLCLPCLPSSPPVHV